MQNKCKNCSEYKRCHDSYLSWIFFIIGLIATVAIRVVTVLMHLNPVYGKIAWYIGVGGFFLFFLYKYNIIKTRNKLILNTDLVNTLNNKKQLKESDYDLLASILCGISSKKERMNFFFIFALSAIALIIAIYIDLFMP